MDNICPRCKKDLSACIGVLSREDVFKVHANAHRDQDHQVMLKALKDIKKVTRHAPVVKILEEKAVAELLQW